MADIQKQYLDSAGLKIVIENLEGYADNAAATASEGAFKYVGYSDNALKFYSKNPVEEGDVPAFSIDLPAEQVIDQARTTFVQEFAWSDETYPGSTNPNLEEKPVLVLAVKTVGGEADTVTYSFLSLDQIVTLYKGGETDTTRVTIDTDNNILVDVKISGADGNLLRIVEDEDGNKSLYASSPAADLSRKANKLVNPETIDEEHPAVIKAGQILVDDGSGDMAGSGVTVDEITKQITDLHIGEIPTITDSESGEQVPVSSTVIEYVNYKSQQAVTECMTAITPEEINAMFGK